MKETDLVQFAYVSHEVHGFSHTDLQRLMWHARRKNRRLELTGLLLCDKPIFLQVLEGPAKSIKQIIEDLRNDERHRDLEIIYYNEFLSQREFARWNMGCRILGEGKPSDYQALDYRVKDIFDASAPQGEIARELLFKFKEMKDSFIGV